MLRTMLFISLRLTSTCPVKMVSMEGSGASTNPSFFLPLTRFGTRKPTCRLVYPLSVNGASGLVTLSITLTTLVGGFTASDW